MRQDDVGAFDGHICGQRRLVGSSLQNADPDQAAGEHRNCQGQSNEPPIGRRLALTVGLFLGGFFCCWRNGEHPNHDWRFLGPLNALGLLLIGLSLFA